MDERTFVTAEIMAGLLESDEYLCGDNFLRLSRKMDTMAYRKFEFIWRSGHWRGEWIESGIRAQARKASRANRLVFGHSSKHLSNAQARVLQLLGFRNVFGTNLTKSKFLHPIPLGLTNDTSESPQHEIFGSIKPVKDALEFERRESFDYTIYSNFDPKNHSERRDLVSIVTSIGVTSYEPEVSIRGRTKNLIAGRKSNYVLCPRGVGVDTHRFWETIMIGSIPIILKSPEMELFTQVFPVLVLEDWNELSNTNLLEESFYQLNKKQVPAKYFSTSSWLPVGPKLSEEDQP